MNDRLVVTIVRGLFALTSRGRARRQAEAMLGRYSRLAARLDPDRGRLPVEVPPMPGVDEDMRRWSFWMLLEHNTIVNRSITAMVCQLARDEEPHGPAAIDIKTGVMPSAAAGDEWWPRFRDSVGDHLSAVRTLGRLRGTRTSNHPVFGRFDAHQWNCMFAFHLRVHLRQAGRIAGADR